MLRAAFWNMTRNATSRGTSPNIWCLLSLCLRWRAQVLERDQGAQPQDLVVVVHELAAGGTGSGRGDGLPRRHACGIPYHGFLHHGVIQRELQVLGIVLADAEIVGLDCTCRKFL